MTQLALKGRMFLVLVVTLLSTGANLFSQNISVKGSVVDNNGFPVIGAGVVVKGTTTGTMTDADGFFSMQVPAGAVLEVSCMGYVTTEVKAAANLTVIIEEDSQLLEDVVVVGYGVQRKSDVTGAISQVGVKEISNRSISNVEQALQGKTAGVQILSSSAAPGSSQTVRVRGFSSNYSSDPLYVVDGLRINSLSSIDPNDIESIEVLKDAASAAIYGAEAGNGVILVTTKRAEKGTSSFSYDMQLSSQSLARNPAVLKAEEYIDWELQGGWYTPEYVEQFYDGVTDTNWSDETFESSFMMKHNLSFEKATDNTNLFISASYLSNDGIVKGNQDTFERITATINAETTIKKWLKIGVNSSVGYSTIKGISESGVIANALYMDPLTPVTVDSPTSTMLAALGNGKNLIKDASGKYYGLSDFSQVVNPFILRDVYQNNRKGINYRATYYGIISPVKGLDITTRLGVNLRGSYAYNFSGIYYAANTGEGENTTNNLSTTTTLSSYYQWENFANYSRSWGEHDFAAMVGVSFSKQNSSSSGGSTNSLTKNDPLYYYLDFSTDDAAMQVNGVEVDNAKYSYFGRLNYTYGDKYIFQVSMRADAADLSVLPASNRWGYFPSVSLGWVLSKEGWFPRTAFIDEIKFRGSWGQNGSLANLSNYMWSSSIGSDISYPFGTEPVYSIGSVPGTLGNLNLKWETSEQYDFGVDFRLFASRLSITMDYYIKNTKDLIVSGITPSLTAGNNPSPVNAGNVSNRGFEFEASWRDSFGDFSYGISGNFATLKNRVTYLDPTVNRLAGYWANGNSYMTSFEEGYPAWYFRGYEYLGVDPETGDAIFTDVDNNGSYDESDMMMIGSGIPDLTYGVTLNLAWKNLDLVVFGAGSYGNDIYMFQNYNSAGRNKIKYFYDNMWTEENPNSLLPRPNAPHDGQLYTSSALIFDGSYFKIKQIQLGYTFAPELLKKVNIKSARAYVSFDDFFNFTSYPGFDPEVASGSEANTIGVDSGNYPTAKKFVFGLNITF